MKPIGVPHWSWLIYLNVMSVQGLHEGSHLKHSWEDRSGHVSGQKGPVHHSKHKLQAHTSRQTHKQTNTHTLDNYKQPQIVTQSVVSASYSNKHTHTLMHTNTLICILHQHTTWNLFPAVDQQQQQPVVLHAHVHLTLFLCSPHFIFLLLLCSCSTVFVIFSSFTSPFSSRVPVVFPCRNATS